MRAADYFRLSCGHALRRRWRAISSIVGVAIGVAMLLVVFAAAQAIQTTSGQKVLGQQSLRQIMVTPVSNRAGSAITSALLSRFRSLPHVVAVYPIAQADEVGISGTSGYIVPLANLPAAPDLPPLAEGRWPGAAEIAVPASGLDNKSGVLTRGRQLMGQTVQLQVRPYQGLGSVTTVSLTVVGVYSDQLSSGQAVPAYTALATVEHLLALTLSEPDAQYVRTAQFQEGVVDVDRPENATSVGQAIDAQGFVTNYVDKQVFGLTGHLSGVQVTAAYAAVLVILLCAFSVGNQVATSVRTRRSELGIMLAIGFGHRALAAIVAGEALALGLAGALLGGVLASVGVAIFSVMVPTAGAGVPWTVMPIVLVAAAALCALFAVIPAKRIMRMDAVAALRAE